MSDMYSRWLESLSVGVASAAAGRSKSTRRRAAPAAPPPSVEAMEPRLLFTIPGYLTAQPLLPTTGRAEGGAPAYVPFQGSTYFLSGDSTRSTKLYKTDGTAAGTTLVKDLGTGSGPGELVASSGSLFFTANGKLWRSDGTAANTTSFSGLTSPGGLTLDNGGNLFFTTSPYGPDKMWEYTGSGSPFTVVTGTYPPSGSGLYNEGPQNPINVNGSIFFTEAVSPGPYQLFRYNGTPGSVTQITTQTLYSSIGQAPYYEAAIGTKLYFAAADYADNSAAHLYVVNSDGTGMTTNGLTPGGVSARSRPVAATNGNLYFVASDSNGNTQVWKTDGTVAGTSRLTDINDPAGASPDGSSGLDPFGLTAVGNNVYVLGADFGSSNSYGVGRLDATTNTVTALSGLSNPNETASAGGTFYLTASDASGNNYGIYRAAGSSGVVVSTDSFASSANTPTGAGANLYFNSTTPAVPLDNGTTATYLPMDLVRVTPVQGGGQTASGGSAFATALQVRVTSTDFTTNLPGVSVTFVAPASGASGTFAGATNSVTVTTDSNGLATAPAFTANTTTGSYSVKVQVGGQSGYLAIDSGYSFSATNLTAAPAPTVTAISPASGSAAGGNTVTITGTNLTAATAVHFGAAAASSFTVNSPTQITATSPAALAGTVDVTVVTAGGTSATLAADQFTFVTPPAVTRSTPTLSLGSNYAGTAGAAQTFTVGGSNLVADLIVTAPSGVELSTDGSTYASTLDFVPVGGAVSATTVYARVAAATQVGSVSGNVTVASSGATTQNVAVSGTVQDPYSHLGFSAASASSANDSGSVTVTVTRTGNLTQVASVEYATADGTASAGTDYTATAGTLTFLPGQSSATINVPLVADAYGQASSTFTMALSSPAGNGVLAAQASETVTVQNNHSPVTIASATYAADGTSGNVAVTVTRAGNTSLAGSVDYATSNGTATAGVDYTAVSGTLSFLAGQSGKTITIPLIANASGTAASTFTLALSNPQGGAVNGSQLSTTVTVQNTHSLVQLAGATAASADDAGPVVLTVIRGGNLALSAAVDYATAAGTAAAGTDYTATSGTLSFAAGESSKTISVPTLADAAAAATSTFTLTLSNAAGSGDSGATHTTTVTLQNNHSLVAISNPFVSASNLAASATVTVTRSGNLSLPASVDYATSDGTATAGTDYTAVSGTLNFSAGQSSQTVSIPLIANATGAASSSFNLSLSDAGGSGVLGPASAFVTVLNARSQVNLASTTATVANDDGSLSLVVTRTGNLTGPATVGYATADGSATAGSDYAAASGTLNFLTGESSKLINIPLIANAAGAATSAFGLTLTPAGPTAVGPQGQPVPVTEVGPADTATVTVQNLHSQIDPAAATATVSNDAGSATFAVNRTGNLALAATVDYATADGTALAGTDYAATSGTLSFAAGESSKTIAVPLIANAAGAATTDFHLVLSNPGDGGVLGTVSDTDVTEQNLHSLVQLATASDGAANTADHVTVTVTRTGNVSLAGQVDYATSDGTALAGTDYAAANGTLSFASGETTKTIDVPLLPDFAAAPTSTFTLALSNPASGAVIGTTALETVTVQNDDSVAELAAAALSTSNLSGFVPVVVTRVGNTDLPGDVDYATADGTALAGADYAATSGTLSFAAGETSKTIPVPLIANAAGAPASTFTLTLSPSAGSGVTVGATGATTVTVANTRSVVQIDQATYSFANDLPAATVTVSRTGNIAQPGSFRYATGNGTALAGTDYAAVSRTVNFLAGESTKTITIPLIFAPARPASTRFNLTLSQPGQNTVLGATSTAAITITNAHSQIQPAAASYAASTDDAAVTFTLTRGGNLSLPVSVEYATADGTATAGTDYTATTGTATFAAGESTTSVTVPLLAHFSAPAATGFSLTLSNAAGGGVLAGATSVPVTLSNAHSVAQFDSAFGEFDEDLGSVHVTVTRSGNLSGPATVEYATSDDTAVAGVNYGAAAGTLHFAAGQATASFDVTYLQDLKIDPQLRFNLALFNATGTMLLGHQTAAVLAIDDVTPPPTISGADFSRRPAMPRPARRPAPPPSRSPSTRRSPPPPAPATSPSPCNRRKAPPARRRRPPSPSSRSATTRPPANW